MPTIHNNPQMTSNEQSPSNHLKVTDYQNLNSPIDLRKRQSMQHSLQQQYLLTKKSASKPPEQVFNESRRILKKSPQIRSPADNQILLQLTDHVKFLADLVENISVDCFKGIMKQAKIQEVRERQLLCEQGTPITHIVIVLDGKLGVCKQQDQDLIQMQMQSQQERSKNKRQSSLNRLKDTKTINTITPMDNMFDQLTALSCKQIQTIRKKNIVLKRKSSVPITAGLFLPLPFSKQEYSKYQIQNYVNPGEEYGAKIRCRSKYHTNTVFAVQKSTLLIIEFNFLVYWFEHAFRAKLGETIQKLKKIPAFSFLEDGKLAQCILFMKKEKKKRNDHIYKQGGLLDKLYILIHGEIKLTKQAKLFQQNPNDLYVDRRKLINSHGNQLKKQFNSKKIDVLQYADLKNLYNFRPMKKTIEIGHISSNSQNLNLFGQSQMIERRLRQTDAVVSSFDCQYYEIQIRKLEQVLGSKFIEQFYQLLQKSARRMILYRQNEFAQKLNWQNSQNLDYFYYQNNKVKQSPRKYKLEKINNKFNGTNGANGANGTNGRNSVSQKRQSDANKLADGMLSSQPAQMMKLSFLSTKNNLQIKQLQEEKIKPYYTTFNFHKLIKSQRLGTNRQASRGKSSSRNKRKDSQDSNADIKIKYSPIQQRLIGISHTWKPIKKKVIQQIKVMQKISPKRHSININQPLIDQKYFENIERQQKRIDRQHKIFKLSLGKRTKW